MRVAVDVHAPVGEPYAQVQDDDVLGMMLRPGFIEVGLQRSAMRRSSFQAGEMVFFPRRMERWVGTGYQERLLLGISGAALSAAREGISRAVELGPRCEMVDPRLAALAMAVNAERIAGFPSGRLFLDSIEQAIAAASWMPLQVTADPCGRCEADWGRHACGWLPSWCMRRWTTS
jgi:AraC family transcriptional regulator